MLGPNFARVMLERYKLEPKFGWGHAQFKKDLADKIEKSKIDPSWRPEEVLRYVAKLVRDS
jgi:hypothetical protein